MQPQFPLTGQSASADVTSATPALAPPDQQIFERHIEEASFQMGCDLGKWRLLRPILWPQVFIAVTAPPRPNSPSEWVFRFDLTGYPHQPPTAGLWDVVRHTWLDMARWPVGTERFALAFNTNWKNGQAIYIPCDRNSLEGHPNWINDHPHMIWASDKDVSFYLNILHDYFHSRHYQGTRPA